MHKDYVKTSTVEEKQEVEISPKPYHDAVDHLTQIMIHDVFSPPVATRMYVYPNIAAYEALNEQDSVFKGLSGQLNGLKLMTNNKNTQSIN